ELKQWLTHGELLLHSSQGPELHIELTGLAQALGPLRQACRW
ncbi:MAG: type VI secretion system-associated protein TagO, partial [Aeromonadaceae bacterium]